MVFVVSLHRWSHVSGGGGRWRGHHPLHTPEWGLSVAPYQRVWDPQVAWQRRLWGRFQGEKTWGIDDKVKFCYNTVFFMSHILRVMERYIFLSTFYVVFRFEINLMAVFMPSNVYHWTQEVNSSQGKSRGRWSCSLDWTMTMWSGKIRLFHVLD